VKKIEILGPGCPKCQKLYEETQTAAAELQMECNVVKVTDIGQFAQYGVLFTPALVVDGVVKVSGKVPSRDDIKKMIS